MGTFGKIVASKTVWGAVALGIFGILPTIAPMVPQGSKTGAVIAIALMCFTIYGRIRAKQSLGPVVDDVMKQTIEAIHVLGDNTTAASGYVTTTISNPAPGVAKTAQLAAVKEIVKAIQTNEPIAAGG